MLENILNNSSAQSIILVGDVDSAQILSSFDITAQDFFELSDDYSIAHIKELLHFINLRPYNSKRKVALIKNIENLNNQSANALLKTLEEPPAYATIILTTLNEQKILPTILSRCNKIRLGYEADLNAPEIYLSPVDLAKMTVAKRFSWAAKAAESEEVEKIILLWLNFYREKLLKGENVLPILTKLNQARDLLQSNISVKLLLENLILNF